MNLTPVAKALARQRVYARPASVDTSSGSLLTGDQVMPDQNGITLRQHFAGQIMAGMCAGEARGDKAAFARWAVEMADHLLEALAVQ